MTKLTTLKDIDIRNSDLLEYNRIGPTPFFHKKLRAAAIEWIKHFRARGLWEEKERDNLEGAQQWYTSAFQFMEFFNITEADLK